MWMNASSARSLRNAAVLLAMITSSYQLSGPFCLPIMSPVRCHQPRIPRHIGGKDRGKTAFDAS